MSSKKLYPDRASKRGTCVLVILAPLRRWKVGGDAEVGGGVVFYRKGEQGKVVTCFGLKPVLPPLLPDLRVVELQELGHAPHAYTFD